MLNTILETALTWMTELGPEAITILVACHMYYELRMKIMKAKQAKIDRDVIVLENDTLKRMDEIRSKSEKRLENLDSVIQNNGTYSDEHFQSILKVFEAIINQNQTSFNAVWQVIDEIVDELGYTTKKP